MAVFVPKYITPSSMHIVVTAMILDDIGAFCSAPTAHGLSNNVK